MTSSSLKRAGLVLGILALAAVQCFAATSFVDTIGTASQYQIGRDIAHNTQVGFDSYPQSGAFAGVRPTSGSVTLYGTSGVPCAQIWTPDVNGVPVKSSGSYAAWAIQPFTPTDSGYAEIVSFVGQYKKTAGYYIKNDGVTFFTPGTTIYVGLVPAPASGSTLSSFTPLASLDMSTALLGKLLTVSKLHAPVTAGTTYWLVFAPYNQLGDFWNPGLLTYTGLDYADLNWAWRGGVSDSSKVSDSLYNATNGVGAFLPMPGHALGVKVVGYAQDAPEKSVGAAKTMGSGPVTLPDVQISGRTGAVGPNFFYVEQPDRSSGIRVLAPPSLSAGEHVCVTGTIAPIPGTNELAVTPDDVTDLGSNSAVKPLIVTTSAISNQPTGCVGELVRIAGAVSGQSGTSFVINDGGAPYDWNSGGKGSAILCQAAAAADVPSSAYASVTGIVSLQQVGGVISPVVLIRSASDIRPYTP